MSTAPSPPFETRKKREALIERFEAAWLGGQRPAIDDYLPECAEDRLAVLVELVHADLECRLGRGEAGRVETYLERYPELTHDPTLLLDLIAAEHGLRRGREPGLSTAEYLDRFPSLQEELRQRLPAPATRPADAPTLPMAGPGACPQVPGYEVLEELGRGGMGVVYRARQVKLHRVVALKMVRSAGQAAAEEHARFLAEAKAIAAVKHPGIVQVFDFGTHEGQPYFSLEFCEGGSLAERLAEHPLPPAEAAHLVEQVARAVQAAHEAGIVHRDLKPGNVLLAFSRDAQRSATALRRASRLNEAVPKVSDFGLAKRVEADSSLTRTGAVMGTPSYMAPEQAQGRREVGPATDVYALGAILYEALSGRPPFQAATVYDTLLQVVHEAPVPPRQLNAKVPVDLETVCLKCLRKEPHRRYASAALLADDLQRWLQGRPVLARPAGRVERAALWARRSPALAGAAVLLVMLLTALIGVLVAFAVTTARDAAALQQANEQLGKENQARQQALDESEQRRRQVVRFTALSARLSAHEGHRLCAEGRVAEGLHYLVRALEIDPEDRQGLHRPIRAALGAWARELHPLRATLPQRSPTAGLDAYEPRRCLFSPDGRRALGTEGERSVQLWDTDEDRLLHTFDHPAAVRDVDFSPDGLLAATTATDGLVRLWKLPAGPLQNTLRTGPGVRWARFVAAGRLVALGGDACLQVWDVPTGRRLGTSPQHDGQIRYLVLSPDGTRAFSGLFGGGCRLWDVATGRTVGPPLPARWPAQTTVTFTPDSRTALVVSTGSPEALLWDCREGGRRGKALTHTSAVLGATLGPDGTRVLTADREGLFLWDAATGERRAGPERWPEARFRAGGVHLAADFRTALEVGGLMVWYELGGVSGLEPREVRRANANLEPTFSPDGRLFLSGDSHQRRALWLSAPDAEVWGAPLPHSTAWGAAHFCTGGQRFVTRNAEDCRLWDVAAALRQNPPVPISNRHGKDLVRRVAFSPNGKVFAVATTASLQAWQTASRRPLGKPIDFPAGNILTDLRVVARGAGLLAVRVLPGRDVYAEQCHLWELPAGRGVAGLQGKRLFALRPDGDALVAAGPDGQDTLLWDLSRVPFQPRPLPAKGLRRAAFSPDGRLLAVFCAAAPTVRLFDAATLKPIPLAVAVDGPADWYDLILGPGRKALLMNRSNATLVEALTGRTCLQGGAAPQTLAFSPDGRFLVVSTVNGRTVLYHTDSWRPVGPPLDGEVAAGFSPDGQHLLTVNKGLRTVSVYDPATGRRRFAPLREQQVFPGGPTFSADGRLFLTSNLADFARGQLWDSHTGLPQGPAGRRALGHQSAFSPAAQDTLLAAGSECVWLLPLPRPVTENVERLSTWVQALTGLELTQEGEMRVLDADQLRQRRRRLR